RLEPLLPRRWFADAGTTRPRLCVARHRNPRIDDGRGQLHCDGRKPPGPESVLPRGNRVPAWLDRRCTRARTRGTAGQDGLRAILVAVDRWVNDTMTRA